MEDDYNFQNENEIRENGSQNNSGNRFGSLQNNINDVKNIRNRIENTKAKNLRKSNKLNSSDTLGNVSSDGLQDGLETKKKGLRSKTSNGLSSKNNATKPIKGGNKVTNGLEKAESTLAKGATNASKAAASASKTAGKATVQAGKAVGKAAVKGGAAIAKVLAAFFATPIGWGVLLVLGIFILAIFIIVIIGMIVSSLSSYFGISGDETLNTYENYTEGMTTGEINDMMEAAEGGECKLGFFATIRNFFGNYNLENPCELVHYVKKRIDEKEKNNSGVAPLSPGYLMASLYYAFETQNYNTDGKPYILPEDVDENKINSLEDLENFNDLDAISTLMAAKIYKGKDIDTLLDYYVFNDVYTYYVWVPNEETEDPDDGSCEPEDNKNYYKSEEKINLFLRYGKEVANQYEKDVNAVSAYEKSSSKCRDGLNRPDTSKYNVKADTSTTTDDNAKITINGVTYGYDSGFIHTTYPRYLQEYMPDKTVTYDYFVDKDIEGIIEYIASRQDYMNYVLGYPNNVPTLSTNFSSNGTVCTYNIDGANVSNIKVRLIYPAYSDALSGSPDYKPGEVIKGEELIDLEKYVMGVVYVENGGAPSEALKVQAIAARSYILGHTGLKRVTENGQTIIEISPSTFHQAYCDPDKGCYICMAGNDESKGRNVFLSENAIPEGAICSPFRPSVDEYYGDRASEFKNAINSVNGMVLTDKLHNITATGYVSNSQNAWNQMANDGLDYVEILRKHYGAEYTLSSPNCSYGATGDWANWRQFDNPWGNMYIGSSTMAQVGCLITSNAMMLANSGKPLVIQDFNPGTFLTLLKNNGGLSGNLLRNEVAIELALGNHNFEYNSGSLTSNQPQAIAEKLNQGYHVIAGVKCDSSGEVGHWVYVTGVSGQLVYMADPASDSIIISDRYNGSRGICYYKYIKFND